eukprot:gene19304-64855_t
MPLDGEAWGAGRVEDPGLDPRLDTASREFVRRNKLDQKCAQELRQLHPDQLRDVLSTAPAAVARHVCTSIPTVVVCLGPSIDVADAEVIPVADGG